jgi:hypothetical protein
MEAEIRVKLPQTKEGLEPPEARKGKEEFSVFRVQRDNGPAKTFILDSWTTES